MSDSRGQLRRNWLLILAVPVVAILVSTKARESLRRLFDGTTPPPPPPTKNPILKINKGWVGLRVTDLEKGGVKVQEVFAGSPAEEAGVAVDDVLVTVNGEPATREGLLKLIGNTEIGQQLTFERQRPDGGTEKVFVTVQKIEGTTALLERLIEEGVKGLAALQKTESDDLWPHYQGPTKVGDKHGRSGVATSALAVWALRVALEGNPSQVGQDALDRGVKALLKIRGPDKGLIDPEDRIPHRAYANSLLLLTIAKDPQYATEAKELRDWLVTAQVNDHHPRWKLDPLDVRYGGWSYYDDQASVLRTDVSTTAFALEALVASALPSSAPEWMNAGLFVDRCQNRDVLSKDPRNQALEKKYRDGGFAFMPRYSKAGAPTEIGDELVVYPSYGSSTADGVRCLMALNGGDPTDPRVEAALRWLSANWTMEKNPGFPSTDRIGWERGIYFYWLMVCARSLHQAKVDKVISGPRPEDEHVWTAEVARFLANRQFKESGCWASQTGLMGEDSPTLATSLALIALSAARDRIAAKDGRTIDARDVVAAPTNEQPLVPVVATDAVSRGRARFQDKNVQCATCHLDEGTGNAPSLVGVADRWVDWKGTPAAARSYMKQHIRQAQLFPGMLEVKRMIVIGPDGLPLIVARPDKWPAQMFDYPATTLPEDQLEDVIEFLISRTGTLPVSGAR